MDMETNSKHRDGRRRFRRWFIFLIFIGLIAVGVYYFRPSRDDVRTTLGTLTSTSKDAGITAKVKAAFALSKTVSAFDINVDTVDGVVHLKGEVPSETVKNLAVSIAEDTAGARVVDNLTVDQAAQPDPEIRRLTRRIADLEKEIAVKDALNADPQLQSQNIRVLVSDGTVRLEGSVEEGVLKRKAELVARSQPGVESVVNDIVPVQVSIDHRSTAEDEPEELAQEVSSRLFATRAFDLERMHVSAKQGTLVLSGNVRCAAEKLLAERIAREVAGVQEVVNDLAVSESGDSPTSESPTTSWEEI